MFAIEFADDVPNDLRKLSAYDRRAVLDRIEEQLQHEPLQETKNRKSLPNLSPPWEHESPVWELRVGDFRVFYDVNESESRVTIRAIRQKPPHKTTEEIL